MTAPPKIFGIGLSKTGTTSLANALQILGYKTRDNMGVVRYTTGDLSSIDLDVVESFDALTDTPIPSFYRQLDARFPGSKFILTVRDADAWLKSCKKQFTQRFAEVQTKAHKQLFIDLYGTDVFDEQRFASGYKRFVGAVHDYFKDRPRDFLVIDITGGEGWDELCGFLGQPVPDIPFPRANVTQITWMSIDDLVAIAREGGRELMRRFEGGSAHRGEDGLAGGVQRFSEPFVWRLFGRDPVATAVAAANKVVLKGLRKLNPDIPVLSRVSALVPYAERRHWNHFWLVDPLDGEGAFVNRTGPFSVDIALIEDGRPLYGVVYDPVADTAYYGRAGKGSFRRVQSNPPLALVPGRAQPAGLGVDDRPRAAQTSQALAMCSAIAGDAGLDASFQRSMEWDTAAAHAVLRAAGMRVSERDSGGELGYNKPDLLNMPIRIE